MDILTLFSSGENFEVFLIGPDGEAIVLFGKVQFAQIEKIVLRSFGAGLGRTDFRFGTGGCRRIILRHDFRPGRRGVRLAGFPAGLP